MALLPGSTRDAQTVVGPTGERLQPSIDGATFRRAISQADSRGTLTEIFSLGWGTETEPPPHVYEVRALPGSNRSWIVHLEQTDRLYFSEGLAKVGLFDARESSPTFGAGVILYLGAHESGLLTIPAGVYHGVRNVGNEVLRYINLPTKPYDYAAPDKYRLPDGHPRIPVDL